MTGNNDFNNTENDSTNSRTEKLWKIIGEEYISYTGGTAFVISNGECKVKLWERLEEAQLFCDKLNEQHETIQSLKNILTELNNIDVKFFISNLEAQRDEFFRGATENAKMNGKLKKQIDALHEENTRLKSRIKYLERKIERERNSYFKQHEKWAKEIKDKSWKITELIIEYDTTNKYSEKDVIDKIKDIMGLVMIE